MPILQCSKCGQTCEVPSHNGTVCNRVQAVANEKTGHCQGIWRPIAQMATGSFVADTNNPNQRGHQSR